MKKKKKKKKVSARQQIKSKGGKKYKLERLNILQEHASC